MIPGVQLLRNSLYRPESSYHNACNLASSEKRQGAIYSYQIGNLRRENDSITAT